MSQPQRLAALDTTHSHVPFAAMPTSASPTGAVPIPPTSASSPSTSLTPARPTSRGHSPPTGSSDSCSPRPARLRKPVPMPPGHAQLRSSSAGQQRQYLAAPDREPTLSNLQDLQQPPGGSSPLLPPPLLLTAAASYSRDSSRDRSSRPGTPRQKYSRPTTPNPPLAVPGGTPMTPTSPTAGNGSGSERKVKKKRSWFARSKKEEREDRGPAAWIAGHAQKQEYDAGALKAGRPVPELWEHGENGNCYVYLFPKASGRGASFKVDSAVFAASPVLTKLAFGDVHSNPAISISSDESRNMPLDARVQGLNLHDPHTPPATPEPRLVKSTTRSSTSSRDSRSGLSTLSMESGGEAHLYLPLKFSTTAAPTPAPAGKANRKDSVAPLPDPAAEDLQTLIDIRNFFAFLIGHSLVATERKSSWFQIFMSIATILKTDEFSNLDGSTFGEVAAGSFDNYVEELGLADVRGSREKTIEGVVLGERMRSVLLYNEAFTHAVGKHDGLVSMKSPKFALISEVTRNRLIRAAMDLEKREASAQLILTDFEFPSLFTGIMNSKTSEERKEGVRFGEWSAAFLGMRKWTISTYQQRYGHWPPKARSKKNDLETSGLNRLVLRDVYEDMSSLYDLLVDRGNLTTRTVDGIDRNAAVRENASVRALRGVLSEYDRSSPPVKPPVPFDLPLLPDLRTTRPEYGTGDKRTDLKSISKKLKDDEIAKLLAAAHNHGDVPRSPFLDAWLELERKAAHGCTIAELVDLRVGQWIFMYVVLQALPMLAGDAPGIKHTGGVEYFLCEPPRGGVPWATAAAATAASAAGRRTWFSVGEGGGVVSLPSDVVEHGVEGIYRRSHCWLMAERWSAEDPSLNSALDEQEAINAEQSATLGDEPPQLGPLPFADDYSNSRRSSLAPPSPGPSEGRRLSSLGIGLEALPLSRGVSPDSLRALSPVGRSGSAHAVVPVHAVDASKTFDAILADVEGQKTRGRKK